MAGLIRPLLLLAFAAFAAAASMRITDALLPRIAADFEIGLARAAGVVTGFAVAYGLMQVPFGPLGDRYGKLRVIAWSSAAAAIASAACYLVGGFHALVVARILAGGCCACIIPLSMAWIGDTVSYEERQPVIARFLLGQIFGLAAGTAAGGFAAESAAWRWPFAALAGWLALAALLIGLESRRLGATRVETQSRLRADAESIFASHWARVVVATVFAEGFLVFGALAFIPTHLHLARGVGLAEAGLALVAYAFGGVAFAVFAGPIVRALGEVRLALAATAMLASGCFVIAWAPTAPLAAVGCLIAGLGFYGLHNTLQTNATQMAPERRGTAMTLFASLFFLGQAVGVAIAGVLVERVGTTAVIVGAGIAIVPAGIIFARLRSARSGASTA